MADTYMNSAGTIRKLAKIVANDGGTLRTAKWIYVNDGGTVRLVYALQAIGADFTAITGTRVVSKIGSSPVTTGVTFQSDGTWFEDANAPLTLDWATNAPDTTGSAFFIKWALVSGTAPATSGPFNQSTYYALSSSRQLSMTRSGPSGVTGGTVDITLATSASGAGAVTRRFTLSAEVL